MLATIVTGPFFSGDGFTIPLTFWDTLPTNPSDPSTGIVQNLTGYVVGCTIKNNYTDTDAEAVFLKDLAGSETGIINFSVPGLAAGAYWIDAKIWTDSGVRSSAVSPQQFTVSQSITVRATPNVEA